MKMFTLAAASAALASISLTVPAQAQSAQERLDARYGRALAAGYKALMLCSGIANAERNGMTRTPESIHAWELTGIQAPLDSIVRNLPYEIVRGAPIEFRSPDDGFVRHVTVEWTEDMPSRVAVNTGESGCKVMPIGFDPETLEDIAASFRLTSPVPPPSILRENAALETLMSAAFDGTYGEGSRTTAVSVFADNNIQSEMFAEGFTRHTPQRTWSVAKSIAATFVGMAVLDGAADIGASANAGEGPGDPRHAITIDQMLRMASGRYSDTAGNRTDPLYWGGTTVDERAANWPLVYRPGTIYRYANNDTLMAVEAIQPWVQKRSAKHLLKKLGMFGAAVETDWQGNFVLSSQVWASTDDLMSLGQLYLRDGLSSFGQRILPEGWREYVSDPSGPQPEGRQWGYGAGFWTFRRPEGNAFEGIPDDAFAARGNRGQYVVIVPSRDVVIVRRGEDMVGTRFDIAAFTKDVLAALE
ncbi:serine hydrolase [Erythrobacter sp.]|nr:serine hydrolase [Erythrobacter sp.]